MKLNKVAAAQHHAAQIVAECIATGWPIRAAILMILVETDARGLPLPDDVLAWATKGRASDDMILPKDRPSNEVLLRQFRKNLKRMKRDIRRAGLV